MKHLKLGDYKHQALKSKTGESYSFSAILSEEIGSKDFFIRHEIVPPLARSSAPHFHKQTDEIVYVLKGNPTAHEDSTELKLSPGDCLCFAADSGLPHFISNPTEQEAELLVLSKQQNTSDVCY